VPLANALSRPGENTGLALVAAADPASRRTVLPPNPCNGVARPGQELRCAIGLEQENW